MLGPLLFIIYVNDLPRSINQFVNLVIYADDTSVLVSAETWKIWNQNLTLIYIILLTGFPLMD